jgi:hypothetical protein
VLVSKALHELVKCGHLKLKGVVIVFPVQTANTIYAVEISKMHKAYDKHKTDYAKAYTVVSVKATAPKGRSVISLFYKVVCEVLEAHTGTVEVLSLTLRMPLKLDVLRTFLGIVSSCTSVTDMRMDMRGLLGHGWCTVDLARSVEAVVTKMQNLENLSWTGFLYEKEVHHADDKSLLYMIPSSLVSLRLAGKISFYMGRKNRFALMEMFGHNKLPNLRVVDLNAYREDDASRDYSAFLLQRLCDENSIVERVILPAQWTYRFKVWGHLSIISLCQHANRMRLSNGGLTIVFSNTDASTSQAQQQYVTDILHYAGSNIVVEWVGMSA